MKQLNSKWECPCDKKEVVQSVSQHHMAYCSCKDFAVDGGVEYTRLIGFNLEKAKDVSDWEED